MNSKSNPKLKTQKSSKNNSKKQDEPLMEFDEFMRRLIRVKPHEIKAKSKQSIVDSLIVASSITVFGLSVTEISSILIAIFTGFSLWTLRYLRKDFKLKKPSLKLHERIEQDNAIGFEVIVVNPSQIGISVENIYLRRKSSFLYGKKIKPNWNHPLGADEYWRAYIVHDQLSYRFAISEPYPKSIYKIVAKTSNGYCSTISHPLSDKPTREQLKTD